MSRGQEERGRVDIDGWAVQMERDMRRAKVQHGAQTITAAPVCGLTQMDRSTASNSHEEERALPRIKGGSASITAPDLHFRKVNIFSIMAFITLVICEWWKRHI